MATAAVVGGIEHIRVYCDSITLAPLWSCQEPLADMKSLLH